MMKTNLASLSSLSLIAVILAACASPQPTPSPPPIVAPVLPSSTVLPPVAPTDTAVVSPEVVDAPTQTPIPVATSRGPDLHATDPTTVSLASGQYQFVEFFRFT